MNAIDTSTAPLPAIGAPLAGGFFAGTFLLEGRIHALIVAPKAEGETEAAWQTKGKDKAPARSMRDGLANSEAINDDDHPAARFCRSLSIGGHDDWYLPSRHEAALLAENLMPGDGYVPEQTPAEAFREGGPEAFERRAYWTSTELESGYAWYQNFCYGYQHGLGKDWRCRVRAVRKCPHDRDAEIERLRTALNDARHELQNIVIGVGEGCDAQWCAEYATRAAERAALAGTSPAIPSRQGDGGADTCAHDWKHSCGMACVEVCSRCGSVRPG